MFGETGGQVRVFARVDGCLCVRACVRAGVYTCACGFVLLLPLSSTYSLLLYLFFLYLFLSSFLAPPSLPLPPYLPPSLPQADKPCTYNPPVVTAAPAGTGVGGAAGAGSAAKHSKLAREGGSSALTYNHVSDVSTVEVLH